MSHLIELQFDDQQAAQLFDAAQSEGMSPQQFAQAAVLRALDQACDPTFKQAMREVLEENRELFRRLAQ